VKPVEAVPAKKTEAPAKPVQAKIATKATPVAPVKPVEAIPAKKTEAPVKPAQAAQVKTI